MAVPPTVYCTVALVESARSSTASSSGSVPSGSARVLAESSRRTRAAGSFASLMVSVCVVRPVEMRAKRAFLSVSSAVSLPSVTPSFFTRMRMFCEVTPGAKVSVPPGMMAFPTVASTKVQSTSSPAAVPPPPVYSTVTVLALAMSSVTAMSRYSPSAPGASVVVPVAEAKPTVMGSVSLSVM